MPNNDGYPTTPGAGRFILVDQGLTAPDGTTGADVQGVKIFAGAAGLSTGFVDGSYITGTTNGSTGAVALFVDPRPKLVRLSVSPAVKTSAYAAKNVIGGQLDFGTASRASGGSGTIVAVQLANKVASNVDAAVDLVLFDRQIGTYTDGSPFTPTDTEITECIGVVPVGAYSDFTSNSVAHVPLSLPALLNGQHIFGYLVARGTPTYTATNELTVTLSFYQD